MNALQNLVKTCESKGITLVFSHVNEQPMHVMEKAGFVGLVGKENFQSNISAALKRAEEVIWPFQLFFELICKICWLTNPLLTLYNKYINDVLTNQRSSVTVLDFYSLQMNQRHEKNIFYERSFFLPFLFQINDSNRAAKPGGLQREYAGQYHAGKL